jgi:hypothetical protein
MPAFLRLRDRLPPPAAASIASASCTAAHLFSFSVIFRYASQAAAGRSRHSFLFSRSFSPAEADSYFSFIVLRSAAAVFGFRLKRG